MRGINHKAFIVNSQWEKDEIFLWESDQRRVLMVLIVGIVVTTRAI